VTIPARPTIYNGIQMRSRLEAGYAAWLDQWNFDWTYEPNAFASERGQYLPDFRLDAVRCSWLADPATVYVEVKPPTIWGDDGDGGLTPAFVKQMAHCRIIHDNEPDAVVLLANPIAPWEGERQVGSAAICEYDPNVGMYWPTGASWVLGPDGTLALARTTSPYRYTGSPPSARNATTDAVTDPWSDGWWKAKP
jgi:hypothetical protein